MYGEIQSGEVAKSYMRKGVIICEEMRKYFPIYEEAVSQIWLCNCSILKFHIYEENLIFFFISVEYDWFIFNFEKVFFTWWRVNNEHVKEGTAEHVVQTLFLMCKNVQKEITI